MAFIRNQDRMVYRTVFDYVAAQLTALSWTSSTVALLPFGATTPVVIIEDVPDPKLTSVVPNTVAFTQGTTPDDLEGELGAAFGGLWLTHHTFFIDIYAETVGVGKALASDLRAVLTGRLPNTSRYQPLMDYSAFPVVAASGHLIHFEDVEVSRPESSSYKLHWEIVKFTAIHQFNATEG